MKGAGNPARRWVALSLCALIALLVSEPGSAGRATAITQHFRATEPESSFVVDHGLWTQFLARYRVLGDDRIARFRYGAVTAEDRTLLAGYVAALEAVPVSTLARREQLAYWINLYNARMVLLVVEHFPVSSVRRIDISPGFMSDGPWRAKVVTVEGQALTLDEIERQILKPVFGDTRIHYALSTAALGSPNLAAVAYEGATVEAMLQAGARAFINHPRGATVQDGRLKVSSLFRWYEVEFGDSDRAIIVHLAQYADPELAAQLVDIDRISDTAFDWTLNDAED